MVVVTRNVFLGLNECACGKYPFRFHNTSKNEFIAKCSTTREEYDPKLKKWVSSKRQPCDFYYVYYGERPVFEEIKNTLIKKATIEPNKDAVLQQKLTLLFRFVFLSNHTSTLDEINLLVKNNLKRQPRKIYYYPSIGNMRISHYEPLEEYRDRIFSKKIVDLEVYIKPTTPTNVSVVKPLPKYNKTQAPTQVYKTRRSVPLKKTSFIVVTDDESESENGSETSQELSDYESELDETLDETEEILDETEEIEETVDDFDETYESGGDDYYD